MNYKQIVIAAVIIFFGCNEEPELTEKCNPDNPLEMHWMAEWIGELQHCGCTTSVFQGEYDGGTVFWHLITDPLCQTIIENIPVFNCLGDEILLLNNNNDWQEFSSKITERKIIFVCSRL